MLVSEIEACIILLNIIVTSFIFITALQLYVLFNAETWFTWKLPPTNSSTRRGIVRASLKRRKAGTPRKYLHNYTALPAGTVEYAEYTNTDGKIPRNVCTASDDEAPVLQFWAM